MNFQKRLIGPCGDFLSQDDDMRVDLNAFLQRLILFDTYILYSTRLKEIPHFINAFGYKGMLELLKSGALRIHCDGVCTSQVGQNALIRQSKRLLPYGSFSFATVRASDREEYIDHCLLEINKAHNISRKQAGKLESAVVSVLEEQRKNASIDTMNQLKQDMLNNSPAVKNSTRNLLHEKFRIDAGNTDFMIKVHAIDDADYKVETDLNTIFNLNEIQIHKLIEGALLEVAHLNQRIEEMKNYSALSCFTDSNLSLFENKFQFILDEMPQNRHETQMTRVLSIKGLPSLQPNEIEAPIDIIKLLRIRKSRECREFREWLPTAADKSDAEIYDQINCLSSKLNPIISSKKGRIVRFLISTGLGFIPGIGITLGPVFGAIDQFLLEKILPHSGHIAFINKFYPSIFPKDKIS